MRLKPKLEHWFGELIPPEDILKLAKRKGRKASFLPARLMTVGSGAPSDSVRLLSGLMERNLEHSEPSSRSGAPNQRMGEAPAARRIKMIKRKLLEEESEY